MTTDRITCPSDFADANGWDYSHVEATAEQGVCDEDVQRLAETDVTPDELLAYCRSCVAERAIRQGTPTSEQS